ncbi:hypothetical protein ACQ86K_00910 [Mucilaginibacter sp. P19]|uniref:hypothetical protein n=1 Tax=Mucilaginibacter sp. P19 TaxID=3423947 RepID=UPI003D67FBB6
MKKQESKNAASHKGHKHEHPRVDISRPEDKEEKKVTILMKRGMNTKKVTTTSIAVFSERIPS